MFQLVRCLFVIVVLALPAWGQDEDEALPSGLIGRYSHFKSVLTRVDRDIQFDWKEGRPDPDIWTPFDADWTGKLLVRSGSKYCLQAYASGQVKVQIDGQTVLESKSEKPSWADGKPVLLEFGEHDLAVSYSVAEGTPAVVRLFWSSDEFPLEPIPAQVLFHERGDPDARQRERGVELFGQLRCGRCHVDESFAPARPGPSLKEAASSVSREWLRARLQETNKTDAATRLGHRMPDFGFTEKEATDVAEFVLSHGQFEAPQPPSGDAHRGEVLFRSVGCLACHSYSGTGQAGAGSGGDLTQVARKRSAAWLSRWLTDPTAMQPAAQMPAVPLSDEERADIVAFLVPGTEPAKSVAEKGSVTAGRQLFLAARCGACHATGDEDFDGRSPNLAKVPRVATRNVERGCLHESPETTDAPRFRLNTDDRTGLRELLERGSPSLARPSAFEHGRRLLVEKNCLGCHDRDGQRGMSAIAASVAESADALRGQSEALIPPDLTAVGDKLTDDALVKSIAGEQPWVRLPWLKVRMPRFRHTPEERDALLAYFIGHDRLPEREGERVPQVPIADPKKKDPVKPGERLLGSKGFNCAACHRIGQFEPRNVALGTRGSDLHGLGNRMRLPYFLRWTRAPLRIVPGMEMPSYEKPAKGLLDEKLDAQLVAMWNSLNEKTAPAVDGSSVEQIVRVAPKGRPIVLRDVFRVGDVEPYSWIARPLVVGFDNGGPQAALFDLDTASLRLWWAGDVARQRTLGKTWFWEPGATVVVPTGPVTPDLALRDAQGRVQLPERGTDAVASLQRYQIAETGYSFSYTLRFKLGEAMHRIRCDESLVPETESTFSRDITVEGLPAGWAPVVLRVPDEVRFGSFGPRVIDAENEQWTPVRVSLGTRTPKGQETIVELMREALGLPASEGRYHVTLEYGSKVLPAGSQALAAETIALQPDPVTVVPGYSGVRLPLDRAIMPTGLTWRPDGTLAVCSLKGQVYLAHDGNGDGLEDRLQLVEEGLAAPYGLFADSETLLVAHKPELLRIRLRDGRADGREVVAQGWGYSDNYHDWTCGIVRDSKGNFFLGLGSDYAQPERNRATTRWRGAVIKVDPSGKITPAGHGFRYPTGLAITPDDQVFVSDNQGVQNTFNEINHLVQGGHYGVPSLADDPKASPVLSPAIQVPHPWTRSVNGLFFLPQDGSPFAGHGIGCEYDTRFLIRFSLQKVGDTYQGATYAFSHTPPPEDETRGFLGTLVGGVSPKGDIYIGSIYDSGWLGGPNVGDIVRLRREGDLPLGIREARLWKQGFEIDFTDAVDAARAAKPENYAISAYTRVWLGAYTTPDVGRHTVNVTAAKVSPDGRGVQLTVDKLQTGYVYEITPRNLAEKPLFPETAHYTVNRIPE